ncbi:tyrosine-type recombinase/integrase [Duganella sp. CT11-72]
MSSTTAVYCRLSDFSIFAILETGETGGGVDTFPAIDVAEARRLALEMRAIVDRGGDPLDGVDRVRAMPTFADFVADHYMPYAQAAKRSWKDDASKLRCHLLPKFGTMKLSEITVRDVQLHHAAMRDSHSAATANRHLALLSAIFRKGVEWGKIDRNPVSASKMFKESNGSQRFLKPDEIGRMYDAMATEVNQTAVAALKLLLLTGTRRQEALSALWSNVDLESGQWWLPQTKSGRGRYVVLNEQAKQLLAAQPSLGTSPWGFPGRDGDKPLHNPRKAFTRILEAAGVDHVRIHDLRHSFASLAVGNGASLYEVQSLLGHSSPQMTQRYAHLADNGLRRASQSVANAINAATVQGDQDRATA